ncbi:sulfurtransferase complex subunit TusB [Salinicola corii]|uniref:Sulfurtransferase complex subunit TusB n=1 Tax=Salinicola corii TaxID=2606937 RepID=A0A640WG76_9GAMM|nr:sulfurtransferase complex subunit TusB [Salinicola corii]KAA0019235.1 sulfurtransferase complex subunit TusB [Salinicola corii]
MMLHLLNRSPRSTATYQDLSEAFGSGDHLLLIEDACYAAQVSASAVLEPFGGRVSVLQEDLVSRGLAARIDPSVGVIDMNGFLALTETHERCVSWF